MKLSTLILLAAFIAVSGTVSAADAKPPPAFSKLDANGDGSLDADEFAKATAAGVKQKFEKLDSNGDGKLSKSEYAVVMGDEDCA